MIRKLTIAAAVIAALIFIGVLIFKRETGPSDAATLVPPETVAFVNFPDLPRTFLRWKGSALGAIGREADVKAFLEKPLRKLMADPGASEANSLLAALRPGNIFLAVTRITADETRTLVGFQFWGDRAAYDKAVERLRAELPGGKTPPTALDHNGIPVVSSEHGGFQLYSAAVGRWGFLSTNIETLNAALDRATGRDTSPSLASAPRLRQVGNRLPGEPDFLAFIQPETAIDALVAAGTRMGAQLIPGQVEALRSAEAVGIAWKIDGEIQRDAVFTLRKPGATKPALDHAAIGFTSPATVVFVESFLDTSALPAALQAVPELAADPRIAALATLAAEAIGTSAGVIIDWPENAGMPSAIGSLALRDRAKALEFVSLVAPALPGLQTRQDGDRDILTLANPTNPFFAPVAVLTDKQILFGLDEASTLAAAASKATAAPLSSRPDFQAFAPTFEAANEIFAFADSRVVFERAYNALRPIIVFGASVMPGVADIVDVTKLPASASISKHLTPMVLSQRSVEDGTLLESSGPLTFNQALLLLGAGFSSLQRPGTSP